MIKKILKKTKLFRPAKAAYHATIRTRNRLYNSIRPTGLILLYHRVADVKNDPHRLSVSLANFEQQIKYLKEKFNIVPLVELAADIEKRKIKKHSVAITFDDGYADNLHNALPILKKFEAPASIFVTAEKIGDTKPFFWEEYLEEDSHGRPLTLSELKTLSLDPLVEIGAHTLTHPKLAFQSLSVQGREISESKKIIEKHIGKPVTGFAFPFGGKDSFTPHTMALVKKAGFAYACANIHHRVRRGSNTFALPRFVIRDWNLEEFKKQLKNFL